nr:hypothetical protein [Rahnella sp. RFA10(1/100)]
MQKMTVNAKKTPSFSGKDKTGDKTQEEIKKENAGKRRRDK